MAKILTHYTGSALQKTEKFTNSKGEEVTLEVYLPSDELKDAVNLAMQLKRPLLIMGEPGCGKTRLAEAVAYELHKEKMDEHFFRWNIKSTTKAKEGIYQYDALKRLYDANLKTRTDITKIKNYISYGKLADAFTKPQNGELPNILLIDEIDKADIDFPNDLLIELDEKVFEIPELGEKGQIKATSAVLIFITSNREKELPPAFLRRCLFHYIDFPTPEKLQTIVQKHSNSLDEATIKKALEVFEKIRGNLGETDKKPDTSELIDWFKMLDYYKKLMIEKPNITDRTENEQRLIAQLDLLDKDKIPFAAVLLKSKEALNKIQPHDE